MALRCLLFTSDWGTAEPICQVLAELGIEGEHCPHAIAAAKSVATQPVQIVIVDWDQQTEAGVLLQAARDRKATERPLTLAVVSDDTSVPKALQAGANSILRKPLMINQVRDTLAMARDLLRSREPAAPPAVVAATQDAPMGNAAAEDRAPGTTLRAGEFLQSSAPPPPAQFETESKMQEFLVNTAARDASILRDLEPVAGVVAKEPTEPDEPRGLQWYLKQRVAQSAPPVAAQAAPAPAPAEPRPVYGNPQLLGYEQTSSISAATPARSEGPTSASIPAPPPTAGEDQKAEAELFAYIAGEKKEEPKKRVRRQARLGKGTILVALALAAGAMVAAPQAPWHPQLQTLWGRGRLALHTWLNPQPNTTAPAPPAHEDFARAGDEYKLPVVENIPDATTDPSQIRVTPVVDPTAKKPNNGAANGDTNAAPADTTVAAPQTPATQTPGTQAPDVPAPGSQNPANAATDSPPPSAAATAPPPANPPAAAAPAAPGTTMTIAEADHSSPLTSAPSAPSPVRPAAPANPQPRPASTASTPPIPSSLKSQMASMTPEASGNKAPEAALPSIEPVNVAESAERALLTEAPAPSYPASAKQQQGTVVLQVLIGRDGTVEDAKFLQGSLAFARAAIDGVKQWKFKPYVMNGRPVSVQTNFTIRFQP